MLLQSCALPPACGAHTLTCMQSTEPRRFTPFRHFRTTGSVAACPRRQHVLPPHAAQRRRQHASQAAAAMEVGTSSDASAAGLQRWLEQNGVSLDTAGPDVVREAGKVHNCLSASRNIRNNEAILRIPGDLCVTSADVAASDQIAAAAEGRGELTGLALWFISERHKGNASAWAPFLQSLPQRTNTPLLWSNAERDELLKGSPVADAARQRAASLKAEWAAIAGAATDTLPADVFSEQAFMHAMSVVLAHAVYLQSAQCFALAPLLGHIRRSGEATEAAIDFDAGSGSVVVTANRGYGIADEIMVYDGRPNGELLMATGCLQKKNPADYLTIEASLVAADRLYGIKKEILDNVGFTSPQEFPITVDGMPLQLLSYLRMSRIQNSAEIAKVSFDEDVIITQSNEYEVLQLLLADCRDRFSAYDDSAEADLKMLQQTDLSVEQRLSAQLRQEEKRVVSGVMDAVRARLAPIRGIPTKQGNLADPNQDLNEIFETLENIPKVPAKIIDGIRSWARGDNDPSWKKKNRR